MRMAVIPARGGSKRIPKKNIREFCGQPIIAWSIKAAIESACFDRIVVSTDDDEIAEVAVSCGAEVPFVRPAELSDDYTGTIAVVSHAADSCELRNDDLVCCVYATAPFVSPADLHRGLRILESSECEFAFAVTRYAFPIQRAVRLIDSQRLEMFDPTQFATRSQDLEEAWHDAGQFYWGRARAWRSDVPVFSQGCAAVELSRFRVQDIDTEEDWAYAELLFRASR